MDEALITPIYTEDTMPTGHMETPPEERKRQADVRRPRLDPNMARPRLDADVFTALRT